MADKNREYRSAAWFGKANKDGFVHRSHMRNEGLPDNLFDGRPIIGICNTWSELTPCNAHFRGIAERVKRGVWESGGFPLEFPVTSTERKQHASDCHAVPQSGQHGCRGVIARKPGGWRGVALWLRQDHSSPGDGRGQL